MHTQKEEDEFNAMMEIAYQEQKERLAGQPDGHEDTYIETPLHLGQTTIHKVTPEMVNQPKHYDWFDMKIIEAIEKVLTHNELMGFLKGTAFRYRMRAGKKFDQAEDIKKAEWYENYYEEYLRKNTP